MYVVVKDTANTESDTYGHTLALHDALPIFFATQCFGAFNDNVYRQAIIGMLCWLGVSAEQKSLYATLAPAIFILPYFLFSALAGQFAERTEKATLIRITTAMEIAIMSLAAIGFATTNMTVLLVALFLTGVQSTLFG